MTIVLNTQSFIWLLLPINEFSGFSNIDVSGEEVPKRSSLLLIG